MANSIAYVLSQNTYPDAWQANAIGVKQGTRIVYATTSTLSSANILFADSLLTQPVYGDGTSYYGIQLLTNTAVEYAITISAAGVIAVTTNPTTTTTTSTTTSTTTTTKYFYAYDYNNDHNIYTIPVPLLLLLLQLLVVQLPRQ